MSTDEDPFGPIDRTPRKPYKPSERRPPLPDDDDDENMQDWYCLPPPSPAEAEAAVDPSETPRLTLQNVVSTFAMNCKVDLKDVGKRAPNSESNPKRLSAVILRLREPKTTALIFASGKGVC